MGLWNWLKSFARQVAEDDLEGTSSSSEGAGPAEPGMSSGSPLYADADTGGAPPSATAPDSQGADEGEADDEAAAAFVVYNDQQSSGGDGGERK